MRFQRPAILLISGALLCLAAAACSDDGGAEPASLAESSLRTDAEAPIVVPADTPIIIGIAAPISGPDVGLGEEQRDATLVGINRWKAAKGEQIEGHDIEIRIEDDGCTEADITGQAAERFLRVEGLVGVLGPSCSAGAAEAIPIFAAAGIVAISPTVTRTDITLNQPEGGFFFRTAYRNDLQGTLIGIFASAQLQGPSAYIVDDAEAYGIDLADNAQRALEANGVSATRETVERGTVDFGPLAAEIAQSEATFVGFAGFNPEAALLYRQLRDAGYTGLFGAGDAAASRTTFVEPVGAQEAEGVLFAACALTLPDDFVAEFEDLHGSAPEAFAFPAQSADAATVLLDAIAAVAEAQDDGSLSIDPIALRDAVRATTLGVGLSGPIAFDANGDRVP